MNKLSDLIAGKSIALVGNSDALLTSYRSAASQIDSHDLVIRMNLGIPTRIDASKIGKRTDILTLGRFWGPIWPDDVQRLIWMKLTKTGKVELQKLVREKPPVPINVWPQDYEDECKEFVGADPGTGIRMLWWLKKKAEPRSVSCFGMDCWTHKTHWSGQMNTPNHSPTLEREAMLKLL